jgi:hypothetical protein
VFQGERDMDESELARQMGGGLKADLFRLGLLPGGVCFLLLSVMFLVDDGWSGYRRDLPWVIVLSLLVAVFFGGAMIESALSDQLRRVAKGEETLTVKFRNLEKEIERDKARKAAREADSRQREKARRLHKLGWRVPDIANELKISTDPVTGQSAHWLVRLYIRSEDSVDISVGGAIATMRELRKIASHAKARLYEQDRPIVEADVEELLRMLADAQQRIDAEMDSFIAKRDDGRHDDEFDGTFPVHPYDLHKEVERTNSLPQEIIDLTLTAAKNGTKGAKVLYDLIVAEMDVGVARFYVTWNNLDTERDWKKAPAWLVRYLAEQQNALPT